MGISGSEIFLIILAVLVFFGANKIPELARGLGKGMREFKRAAEDIKSEINNSTSDVRCEVDNLKSELNNSTSEMRNKVDELKSELNTQTTNIKKEVEELRDDIDKTDVYPKP